MKKLGLGLFLFVFQFLACGGTIIEIGTPIFERPADDAKCLSIITKQIEVEPLDEKISFFIKPPLSRYHKFYEIWIGGGKTGWVCPELRVTSENGNLKLIPKYVNSPLRKFLLILFASGLLAIIGYWTYCIIHRRKMPPMPTVSTVGLSIAFIVLLRWLLLLVLIMGGYNIITAFTDELGYFQTAIGFIKGDFSGPWRYTIGLGFLYIPFILMLNATQFSDIAVQFAYFSGFILMPGCLVMTYVIVRKLTGSQYKGFFTALLWTVIPVFYNRLEFWDERIFKSFFALPDNRLCFRFYQNIISTGFNGMSDTASTFFILLGILLCIFLPVKIRSIALISFVYGFACLIRINNIFFSPLIAWLLWCRFKVHFLEWKYFVRALSAAIIIFLGTFGLQLIINKMHFGHYFSFPYVLHGSANAGFRWICVSQGIQYLGGSNLAYWALGVAGIFFVSGRKLQITLILWAVPIILFFFGYPYAFCDSHRFIMSSYSAVLAAFVCADVWNITTSGEKVRLIAMLSMSLLLVCPSAYFWDYQLPWNIQQWPWGIAVAHFFNYAVPAVALLITLSFHKNTRLMYFSFLFMILFFAGNPYIFAFVFVILLIWAMFLWISDIFSNFRKMLPTITARDMTGHLQ
jgi:hypothetical protein